MLDLTKFYINGKWVAPCKARNYAVFNPADEAQIANISLGGKNDVDNAVLAAKNAFVSFSQTSLTKRLQLLENLLEVYNNRYEEMAQAISLEMGAPIKFSRNNQAACGNGHIKAAIDALKKFPFKQKMQTGNIVREPIGICGLITPWNWPINQIACKVAPALATGCVTILKASELAPLSSHLFAQMIDEAGYPAGVFNLIDGLGIDVGAAISSHPDIDMISFTGSTQVGISISNAAANSIKRVCLELGGKSPNIILDSADFKNSVEKGVSSCFNNTGQSCNAPTRMLVSENRYDEAINIIKKYAPTIKVGNPKNEHTKIGPLVSETHFNQVQKYIDIGIKQGAKLITGGLGKPDNLEQGYFVKPSVFVDVDDNMTIVKEEIFGPVLCLQKFKSTNDAIQMANNSPYGLAAYISGEQKEALEIAKHIRAGMIHINGVSQGFDCPFGGYKQSGNGREWGEFGFEDYLETKVIAT